MSKQSEAKTAQGYTKESACCKQCKNFSSDITKISQSWWGAVKESNKRCGIGGFAVQSSAHCKIFVRK